MRRMATRAGSRGWDIAEIRHKYHAAAAEEQLQAGKPPTASDKNQAPLKTPDFRRDTENLHRPWRQGLDTVKPGACCTRAWR